MTHARTQIRAAIATQITGLPITGSNVFSSRIRSLDDDTQMPALMVKALSESHDTELSTMGTNVNQWRVLDVEITILALGVNGEILMTDLDDIAEDVEDAIYADKTLGGIAKDTMYVGMSIDVTRQSAKLRTDMTLEFQVMYRIQEPVTGTIIQ